MYYANDPASVAQFRYTSRIVAESINVTSNVENRSHYLCSGVSIATIQELSAISAPSFAIDLEQKFGVYIIYKRPIAFD